MPRDVASNPVIQKHQEIQSQLQSEGIDSQRIDEWIRTQGLDSILADNKLLLQYFSTATKGLAAITSWDYDNRPARPAEVIPPQRYQAFYQNDTSGGTPYADYFPAKNLFDPSWLVQNNYFSQDQASALQWAMDNGLYSTVYANLEAETSASVGTPKIGNMAVGGQGKAMATRGKTTMVKGLNENLPPPPNAPQGLPQFGNTTGPAGGSSLPGSANYVPGQFSPSFQTGEYEYINSIGSYESGVLSVLMGDMDFARGVAAQIVMDSDSARTTRENIIWTMKNLDPTDPQQAHQLMVLQQEMQMVNNTMRENQDKLLRVQHFQNERVDLTKSILEIFQRTDDALIRNMRVGS